MVQDGIEGTREGKEKGVGEERERKREEGEMTGVKQCKHSLFKVLHVLLVQTEWPSVYPQEGIATIVAAYQD